MTLRRKPNGIEDALTICLADLTDQEFREVIRHNEHYVRKLADPNDERHCATFDDVIRLDRYRLRRGMEAVFLPIMEEAIMALDAPDRNFEVGETLLAAALQRLDAARDALKESGGFDETERAMLNVWQARLEKTVAELRALLADRPPGPPVVGLPAQRGGRVA